MNPLLRGLTRLGLALMVHMSRWPLPVLRALGVALGLVLYAVVPSRRHIVQSNLALCFPELSRRERHRMARRSFVCFAQTWLDRSWLWHAPRALLERRLTVRGALHEFDGLAPTIVFSPHFYGLDAGATAINMTVPRHFTGIYTPQANPLVDEWILAGRQRMGRVRMFQRIDGAKANLDALRAGEVLYILPDMDFGPDGSVFVPFFGVPAATVASLHRFARLGRAKVVPVMPRLTPQGYEVEVFPAWTDFPTRDLVADTARGSQLVERFVTLAPEQYFWVHKRFKSRPPGHPPAY